MKKQLTKNEKLEEDIFSREYTQFIKGIGILILIFHHLILTNLSIEHNISEIIVSLTKVCVALFTILSGYGMKKSYDKNTKSTISFVVNHLKRLMINYWWVYIPAFFLSFFLHKLGNPIQIYCVKGNPVINFWTDFLGLRAVAYTPTLNEAWWYMEITIVFYLIFPIINKGMKKIPVITLLISLIPIISRIFLKNVPWILKFTDREIYYLFPFVIGILLAEKNILDKVVKYFKKEKKLILICASILLIICCQILTLECPLLMNTFYAISIILFGIGIKNISNVLNKALQILGNYSMDIFLTHSFFHGYFTIFYNLIMKIPTIILKYAYLILISLFTSIFLEKTKKYYSKIQKRQEKI